MALQCDACGAERSRFYVIGFVDGEYVQLGEYDYFSCARTRVRKLGAEGKLTDAEGNVIVGTWPAHSTEEAMAKHADLMRRQADARAARQEADSP